MNCKQCIVLELVTSKNLEGPICHRCAVSNVVSDLMSFVLYTATATGL